MSDWRHYRTIARTRRTERGIRAKHGDVLRVSIRFRSWHARHPDAYEARRKPAP